MTGGDVPGTSPLGPNENDGSNTMDENVIAERDGYRVRLALDTDAQQPYNDGATPIWRIEHRYTRADARLEDKISSYEPDDLIGEAIDRFWDEADTLERYLRIFHGATAFERWHSGSSWYFTCDPADWREEVGITPEIMAREDYSQDLMSEWKSWCEGDVYGVIVEERAHWQRVDDSGTPVRLPDVTERDTWEEVEAVWGHYGYDWATQSAIDALSGYVPDLSATCDQCPWTVAYLDENERYDAQFKHYVQVHGWRKHVWPRGGNGICQRSGCNTMGTGDWYNDGECEGT